MTCCATTDTVRISSARLLARSRIATSPDVANVPAAPFVAGIAALLYLFDQSSGGRELVAAGTRAAKTAGARRLQAQATQALR